VRLVGADDPDWPRPTPAAVTGTAVVPLRLEAGHVYEFRGDGDEVVELVVAIEVVEASPTRMRARWTIVEVTAVDADEDAEGGAGERD
jgi:hypothetical protein